MVYFGFKKVSILSRIGADKNNNIEFQEVRFFGNLIYIQWANILYY